MYNLVPYTKYILKYLSILNRQSLLAPLQYLDFELVDYFELNYWQVVAAVDYCLL